MPLLGGLIASLFVGLAEFLVKFVTRKVAVVAAGIAVFIAITTTLYVALAGLVVGMVAVMPGGAAVAAGIWMVVPDNAAAVVSACLAADAAIAVYRMNVMNVMFSVYAG